MRRSGLSGSWCAGAAAALVFCVTATPAAAQVDWSLLFPEEAGAPEKAEAGGTLPAAAPAPAAAPTRAAAKAPTRKPPARVAGKPSPVRKARKKAAPRPHKPAPVRVAAPRPTKAAPRRPAAAPAKPPKAPPPQVAELAPRPPRPPAGAAQPPKAAPPAAAAPAQQAYPRLADFGLTAGEVLTAKDLPRIRNLVSPGLEWAIGYGWRLRLVEPRPIHLPRRYREATEKFSSQVRMAPGGRRLVGYVAGMPFPHVDPNDPDAVLKIMWNFDHNFMFTDDVTMRYFEGDTGSVGRNQRRDIERHYIFDAFRRLMYTGRLYVDPKPNLPNPDGFRWKESLHPILEPFDLKGVGGTFYRYLDPERQDDSWIYLPTLRRVRRLSSAQRSDALFGQDTDPDSFWGYNGHIAWMDYKLLGERFVLATMHAENVPVKWQEPEDWLWDDVWEPRKVWVVETRSKFKQYAYGKRIIFLDKESYLVTHSDIYDRAGQLWKVWVNMWSLKQKAIPTATRSVYPDDMPFQHALIMLDTQLAHATSGALPSTKSQGEETWFFNFGERMGVTEEFFSIAHLIQAGR